MENPNAPQPDMSINSAKKKKVRKAVLTDAGYATRFLPITKTLPKSMLPIMDKPITQYIVEECMYAGITEIIMVTTDEGKEIYEDYFHNTVQHIYGQLRKQGKEKRFDKVREVFSLPNVIVITQDKKLPYGNGTPALSAKPYIGDEPFLYLYTDDVIFGKSSCLDLVEAYEASPEGTKGIIAAQDIPGIDVTKYGIIKLKDGTENVLDFIVEKPEPANAPSSLISFGRYLLTPDIFKHLEPKESNLGLDAELWMVDAIHRLAKEEPVLVKPISGQWKTTGDPSNYMKTVIDYALSNEEYREDFLAYIKEKLQ